MRLSSINHSNIQPTGFTPPQSAQQYQSIFGGPSSQDAADLGSVAGRPIGQHDDVDMDDNAEDLGIKDNGLIAEDSADEDDPSYEGSDESNSADEAESSEGVARTPHSHRKNDAPDFIFPKDFAQDLWISRSPSPPPYRPNRFEGHGSTWRKLTLEDRQNAQALDAIRARDLGVHLYNSFALRARARALAQSSQNDAPERNANYFVPPKRWAAWPMPANEVPRVDDYFRARDDDALTLRRPSDLRASAELEESLIAAMQKAAKERFNSRRWKGVVSSSSLKMSEAQFSQPGEDEETASHDTDMKCSPDLPPPLALRPVIQADDELSRRQLRPLARRTLTHLDSLLMGLHHARKPTARADDSSASEGLTDTESALSESSLRREGTDCESAGRDQSRGRKKTRRVFRQPKSRTKSNTANKTLNITSNPKNKSVSSHVSRARGRSSNSDDGRLASRMSHGLRDWNHVLGVASLIGWPSNVVMSAAHRCAHLFGEDMEFQTLKEGKVQRVKHGKTSTWQYAEGEEDESPPRQRSKPKQPVSRYPSRNQDHDHDPADQEAPKGKGPHRMNDIVCPVTSCPRHSHGFSRTWNRTLHMKRMHPSHPSMVSGRSSSESDGSKSGPDEIDNN